MGILADIGRSNIGEQAIRLQTQALNIRELQDRKRQQDFENILKREDLAIKRETQAAEKRKSVQQEELTGLQIAGAKRKEQKEKEEEAALNAPVNLTSLFSLPEVGPLAKNYFEQNNQITGNIKGDPYTTQRNLNKFHKFITTNNELFMASFHFTRSEFSKKLADVNLRLNASAQGIDAEGKAVKPLKPEEVEYFSKQKALFEKALVEIDTAILGMDEKARLEKMKAGLKPDKPNTETELQLAYETEIDPQKQAQYKRTLDRIASEKIRVAKESRAPAEKGLTPEVIDKMYAQYNLARAKAPADPIRLQMISAMKTMGIDVPVSLPKMTKEQFTTFIKEGTMPGESIPEEVVGESQSEIDVYKNEVKKHFNQGVEPKKILEAIRSKVPEKLKKEVEGYLLGLDIKATMPNKTPSEEKQPAEATKEEQEFTVVDTYKKEIKKRYDRGAGIDKLFELIEKMTKKYKVNADPGAALEAMKMREELISYLLDLDTNIGQTTGKAVDAYKKEIKIRRDRGVPKIEIFKSIKEKAPEKYREELIDYLLDLEDKPGQTMGK